ncbi:MAG: hypothetical protein GQ564_00060 [Bacteroidales bacterium]|nr:hypothetical protein [Bacteroidales bacterium]
MLKLADILRNSSLVNLVSISSYKFWLALFLFCFYFDVILIAYPELINLDYGISYFERVFYIIISSGFGLGFFYILYTFITLIIFYLKSYLPKKENKRNDYADSNMILDSQLEKYAILLNRSDLMDMYKSYKLEKEKSFAIRFFNFVLLGLIILNIKFNGIVGKLIDKSLFGAGNLIENSVYIIIYLFLVFLIIKNITYRIKYENSLFLYLDSKIQEQLKFEVEEQRRKKR